MFDVVGKHSIAAKANRYTTIKGLTEGQLWVEVVKGIIEQIQCVGHLQLCLAMVGQGFTQLQT